MTTGDHPALGDRQPMLPPSAEVEEQEKRLSGLVAAEATHFPGCDTEHYMEEDPHRSSWKVFSSGKCGRRLKGMLSLSAREASLPENKLRALIHREIWRTLLRIGDRAYHCREFPPSMMKGWVQVVERAGFTLVVRFEESGNVRQADLWDLHQDEHPCAS
jgi:hypothetical protein